MVTEPGRAAEKLVDICLSPFTIAKKIILTVCIRAIKKKRLMQRAGIYGDKTLFDKLALYKPKLVVTRFDGPI